MMMSPTALIDTGEAEALLGAPGELDNCAPDVEAVCSVAADVSLCPPAVVHAAVTNVSVTSTDTRRRRDGRLANAERRAASMLILWALADGGTGRVADRTCAKSSSHSQLTFATPTVLPEYSRGRQTPSATKHSRQPFDVLTELTCRNVWIPATAE